jgi:hypothetical protein
LIRLQNVVQPRRKAEDCGAERCALRTRPCWPVDHRPWLTWLREGNRGRFPGALEALFRARIVGNQDERVHAGAVDR